MSAIAEFFVGLGPRGRSLLPPRVHGTLRIDLVDQGCTSHWYVDMTAADRVLVTRDSRPADAVLTTTHRLFERLVCGDQSAIAVLLRNEATFAGDTRLILAFRRFFPSPAGTRDPREVARQHALHGQAWRERLQTRIS